MVVPVVALSATLSPTIGFIRSIDEVLSDSTDVLQISVEKIGSGGCGKEPYEYSVWISGVFKGELRPSNSYQFCGYSGLETDRVYVVGLWRDQVGSAGVLYPDAIFIEQMPDEFYRQLSYETHVKDFDGKRYLVEGIEVPGFKELLEKLPR